MKTILVSLLLTLTALHGWEWQNDKGPQGPAHVVATSPGGQVLVVQFRYIYVPERYVLRWINNDGSEHGQANVMSKDHPDVSTLTGRKTPWRAGFDGEGRVFLRHGAQAYRLEKTATGLKLKKLKRAVTVPALRQHPGTLTVSNSKMGLGRIGKKLYSIHNVELITLE